MLTTHATPSVRIATHDSPTLHTMESDLHALLKRCAKAWLHAADASAVACEVTTAIPHWRADVAAWMQGDAARLERLTALSKADTQRWMEIADGPKPCAAPTEGSLWASDDTDPLTALLRDGGAVNLFAQPDRDPEPATMRRIMRAVTTVVVECKATRADFLSDRADLERAASEHARLQQRRDRLREQLVRRWEPHLQRAGESLFPETDGWDFERSKLASVRSADRDARLAETALQSQVKFARMARWRIADRLYLCCPAGMLKAHELPEGWGLLEHCRGAMRLRRGAAHLHSPETRRWRTVRNVHRSLRGRP